MGSHNHVVINFKQPFTGTGKTDKGTKVGIGGNPGEAAPYELLLMALGSCLYSTFEDIIVKKKLDFDSLEIDLSSEKRDEVPTTMKECSIEFLVKTAPENETAFRKSLDLACKYCSIYNTLQHVSKMETGIRFL